MFVLFKIIYWNILKISSPDQGCKLQDYSKLQDNRKGCPLGAPKLMPSLLALALWQMP